MAAHAVRERDKDSLARFLGWFSMGLGATQLALPGAMCKLVGGKASPFGRALMRTMGVRELTQGVGILTRPRPTRWVQSRVAGDALDLTLLGLTALRGDHKLRTAFAIANAVPVAVADFFESKYLVQLQGEPKTGMLVRKTVTIRRTREHVEQAWNDSGELRQKVESAGARVTFADAPGNRGTELAVEFERNSPAGDLGGAVLKLTGRDLATQLSDDLRRLKQEIETGEPIRSDGAIGGHTLKDHVKQRAAQPVAA